MAEQVQWTSDDVPRFALGEGKSKKGDARHKQVTGIYLYTVRQQIKGRVTFLHRLGDAVVDGEKIAGECLVYGSGAVNTRIVRLPPNTPVRLTYKGEKETGMDTPMKDISVEWPRGVKLLANAALPREAAAAEDDGEDVPF